MKSLYILIYLFTTVSTVYMFGSENSTLNNTNDLIDTSIPEFKIEDYIIPDYTELTYEERIPYAHNPVTKKLFTIAVQKKTNVIAALDVDSFAELILKAAMIGQYVAAIKIHADTLPDFSFENIEKLQKFAQHYNFLIIEDRKLSDIGKICAKQYTGGSYRIADWADLVTVHSVSGKGSIKAMHDALNEETAKKRGAITVAQMSSNGNLLSSEYTVRTLMQIRDLQEETNFIAGVVTRNKIYLNDQNLNYGLFRMIPGVEFTQFNKLDQQYITPKEAFEKRGADFVVVGNALYNSPNIEVAALTLKTDCWNAYLNRLRIQK